MTPRDYIRPFDKAQGRPFDKTQGKHFDKTQGPRVGPLLIRHSSHAMAPPPVSSNWADLFVKKIRNHAGPDIHPVPLECYATFSNNPNFWRFHRLVQFALM